MSDHPAEGSAGGAPELRPTGHARVDAVLAGAAGLAGAPVAEHAARYEAVHAALVAELNAEPGTVPSGLLPPTGASPARGHDAGQGAGHDTDHNTDHHTGEDPAG